MGLEFAIDELYATGWTIPAGSSCPRHSDGRAYPGLGSVRGEFEEAGCEFSIRHVQLFDCYRAEWREPGGAGGGAVVGRSEAEAAVYALAQLRRSRVPVGVV